MSTLDSLPTRSIKQLRSYVQLLDKWRKVTNLISDRSFAEIWSRHIGDSVHLQRVRPSALRWLDIGSGAGFPGIVLGILLAEHEDAQIHCVEIDSRKCAFLRATAGELGIPVKVHNMRAEDISTAQTGQIDAITARAFSTINDILQLTHRYLSNGAVAVLPRGKTWTHEVETLDTRRYAIAVNSSPGGGAILTIQERP